MKLRLVKPDLAYYAQYNEMMTEWCESKTQIAPWFLDAPFVSLEEYAQLVRMLDNCEHGIVDPRFAATTSYFVMDESGRLIGAVSLRHYLTVEGFRTWGHIGYGIRPEERGKGYGIQALRLALEQAREKKIDKVLIGVHEGNIPSRKTVEHCGGILENTVRVDTDEEPIRRYWINLSDHSKLNL